MADINVDELGPVDYLVVRFPEGKARFSGEMASELKALIENQTIRVLDLVILTKAEDGSLEAAELRDVDDSDVGELRELERELAILLARRMSSGLARCLNPRALRRSLSGRTAGRHRSPRLFAGRAVSL